jgi:hypothetical protein
MYSDISFEQVLWDEAVSGYEDEKDDDAAMQSIVGLLLKA